jgi:hypothetical protein
VVVAKVRRLAVNKTKWQRFHMQKFNLVKLKGVEGNKKYHL